MLLDKPNALQEVATTDDRKPMRVTEDVFASVLRRWKIEAPKWNGTAKKPYSKNTKDNWDREIRQMESPDALGSLSVNEIRPSRVAAYLRGLADRPAKQKMALAILGVIESWALLNELLPREITRGIELEYVSGGHLPWTDEQVALAEAELPTYLSRIITLVANTGQRGVDIVRMGPTHLKSKRNQHGQNVRGMEIVQVKTKKKIWFPLTKELAAAIDSWPKQPGPFVRNAANEELTRNAMSAAWNWHRTHNPKLSSLRLAPSEDAEGDFLMLDGEDIGTDKGLVLHGLRGTACVRLQRNNASTLQIAHTVGMSVAMVERYVRQSRQIENAMAMVYQMPDAFAVEGEQNVLPLRRTQG